MFCGGDNAAMVIARRGPLLPAMHANCGGLANDALTDALLRSKAFDSSPHDLLVSTRPSMWRTQHLYKYRTMLYVCTSLI